MLLLLALSCHTPAPEADTAAAVVPLSQLARASLDLRGARPTLDEIAAFEADPAVYPDLVEAWLADPGFGERVRSLYAEVTLTHTETYDILVLGFGGADDDAMWSAVGDEPLRLMSTVAEEDRPWTDIVTADWSVVHDRMEIYWPVDYPEGATGWQVVHYTDGRPAAGILSTNGLWWRYLSTASNGNRKRANALSRILLCNDYTDRPIAFDPDVDITDDEAVADAVSTVPGCVSCHATLDPLAGFFYGFWNENPDAAIEASRYHPEREGLWELYSKAEPAYFGVPAEGLAELGQLVAADPRFVRCAVEQVYGGLLGRDLSVEDEDAINTLRAGFLDNNLKLRSIFRGVALGQTAWSVADDGAVPTKMLSPDLMASAVAGVTGFSWTIDGEGVLSSDIQGLRTLAGGADGYATIEAADLPVVTLPLVQGRLAEAGAQVALAREAALAAADRTLFTEVDLDDPAPSDAAVAEQIGRLVLAAQTRRVEADSDEVAELAGLWEALAAETSPAEAWGLVLAAVLSDPAFLMY